MTDETVLAEQTLRGESARQILENPVFNEAFEDIRQFFIESWQETRGDETEKRENAYIALRLLQNLKEQFEQKIANGEFARKKLLEIKDKSKIRGIVSNG